MSQTVYKEADTIHPKVLEGYSTDVGHGIARLDEESMRNLNVIPGDIVEIQAKRRTVAKCEKLSYGDDSPGLIRIDGIIRNNSGSGIGDTITVSKIKIYPAKEVTVKPLENDKFNEVEQLDGKHLADYLDGVPIVHADNIMIPHWDGWLFFSVIETFPSNVPILVSKKTVFRIVDYIYLQNSKHTKSLEILKERYAKGEITRAQFTKMKKDLQD